MIGHAGRGDDASSGLVRNKLGNHQLSELGSSGERWSFQATRHVGDVISELGQP